MTRMQDFRDSLTNLEKSISIISTKVDKIDAIEAKLDSRFTEINSSILNIREVVIQNLLNENKRLDERIQFLENRLRLTEVHVNALESYDRRNNLEFEGIPSNVEDVNLEASVIKICNSIGIKINNNDIEDCHRLGKNDPKKINVKK